jgi:hypothetical protein
MYGMVDGPWSLSFAHILRSRGPFSWPSPDDDLAYGLASMLQRLNELPLFDVLNMTRASQGKANKPVEDKLTDRDAERLLTDAFARFAGQPTVIRFSITYCLTLGDPRRILGHFNTSDRILFPALWDPEHRAIAFDDRLRGSSAVKAPCPLTCLHPRFS